MENNNYDALKLENQLCFPLYAASREVIKQYRPYLDRLGLTYTQYIAMMVFWEEKIISVRDIGKKLCLDSGTLTPMLKTLEQKGFVRRYRCPEDERVLLVEVTEAGMQLRDEALAVPSAVASCVKLSKEEALQLYTLLYKILDQMNE